ncbi:YncE family protein [Streptomyces goshikiensis]|uniref:YncE family protein n=1 Tax=Streptomyces goshikiensis TaxID=1942 RepID=UPI0022F3E253|nr:YncE family protein [Streptomyces goshikiensis]WBY18639.1 YncE family protein [Streptomyces goshikiensis]
MPGGTAVFETGFYHANSGRRSELTVIDPDTRRIVEVVDLAPEHAPHGLTLDAARGLLYVSVEGGPDRSGGVVVIDTATRRPIGRIDTGAPGPHWFVVDATGTTGYASNKEAPFVSVVDLRLGKLTDRIEVPGSEGIAVSPDGSRVFVAAPYGSFAGREYGAGGRPANGVRIIDTARAEVTATLATEGLVFPVHHTATGRVLAGELRMAPDPGAPLGRHAPGRLTVFSGEGGERLGGIEVGLFPLTVTSSPDGRTGYVACVVSSTGTWWTLSRCAGWDGWRSACATVRERTASRTSRGPDGARPPAASGIRRALLPDAAGGGSCRIA